MNVNILKSLFIYFVIGLQMKKTKRRRIRVFFFSIITQVQTVNEKLERFLGANMNQCISDFDFDIHLEADSNTSTVTLLVVGGDEKESLKSEKVKYGYKFQGTWTRERLPGEGQQHIQKTDSSSRQRGRPTKTRP
jgi:hypothetical protein